MSEISSRSESPLPLSLARRINEVCNRFELAWQAGLRPRPEDFVGETPEPERSALLRELIALDIDYRRQAGEKPTAEEYRERFPAVDLSAEGSTVLDSPRPPNGAADLSPASAGATQAGRYQLGEEIGHGGMGAVLQGHDPDLGRDVAIKVLHEEHRDQPDLVRRFIEEAQVGGQLQHPGVVPVHERGTLSDGRPFFTMKLVQGRNLAQLLKERPDPAHNLPRFLKIFEQVCETLAYAHSKGVLHRDLKPSNIMVGAFGEVHVMDWGVAKVLVQTPAPEAAPPASTIATVRSGDAEARTSTGAVLGTFKYMPPEQASGAAGQLDRRCDVFGLGAVLCEILTGQPPYTGTREQVRLDAQAGHLAPAQCRLEGCGADAELVRLAQACLQGKAEDRPSDAGVVAEAVTAYLAGVQERLRQAEVAHAQAEVKVHEERKRRRLAWVLATALLLLVGGAGTAVVWYQQQQAAHALQLTRAAGELSSVLEEAGKLAERTATLTDNLPSWQATLAAARSAVERAEALLVQEPELATEGWVQQVGQLRAQLEADAKDWQLLAVYEQIRLEQSQWDPARRRFKLPESYPRLKQALADYGLAIGGLKAEEAAARLRQRPLAVQPYLRAVLEECFALVPKKEVRQRQWLEAVLDVDADPWLKQFRQAVAKEAWAELEQLAAQAEVSLSHPAVLIGLAVNLPEEARAGKMVLLRRTQQQYPGDFWVNFALGDALYHSVFPSGADRPVRAEELPVVNEALAFWRVAVGLRPGNAPTYNNLGLALQAQGDVKGAIACWRKALALEPTYAPPHNNLGNALLAQGDVKGAIACYRKALDLDPKDAKAHYNLGNALHKQGDVKGAIACYQKALDLDPKIVQAHYSLGKALDEQGDVKGAIACYRKALTLDPKYAKAHNNLGNALYKQGDLQGAIACYKEALALDPKLAPAHTNLGNALQAQGDVKGAIACYKEALTLDPKHASAHNNLGNALAAQGDMKGAIACYKEALALDPKLVQAHVGLGNALYDQRDWKGAIACYKQALTLDPKLALAHTNLGNALKAQGDLQGAIACYKEALALDPKFAPAHTNLGNALQAQGDVKGAIACYKEALTLDPKYPYAHYNLGLALKDKGDWKGAIACYRKALDLDPKLVQAHIALANVLYAQGDVKGAIACYKRALTLEPKDPYTHGALGRALLAQGAFQEARAATQQALQLLPKGHPLRPLVTRQLHECQRLLDLDARLSAIDKGDDQPKDAAEQLALADLCQRYKKQYAAAARFYADAFAAKPILTAAQQAFFRYNAACAAVLAAAGKGEDAAKPQAKEKSRLRQQARAWLQDNLKLYTGQLDDLDIKKRADLQKTLQHWQKDPDLDSVRGKEALAKLPAAERAAWQEVWGQVETLLKKTQESTE
jgi:tetratricopeptide (TPR) repeat protein